MPPALHALLAIAALSIAPTSLRAASEGRQSERAGLWLDVQMADKFLEGDPIRFRMAIENPTANCHGALIDAVVVPRPCGDRPFSVIRISLRQAEGEAVPVPERPLALNRSLGPGELLSLGCGEFFGGWFEISSRPLAFWRTTLPSGSYCLNVSVDLRVRTYFEKRPELLAAEAARRSIEIPTLTRLLADHSLESRQLCFTVVPVPPPSAPPPESSRGDLPVTSKGTATEPMQGAP
jgi:hypothetical protein